VTVVTWRWLETVDDLRTAFLDDPLLIEAVKELLAAWPYERATTAWMARGDLEPLSPQLPVDLLAAPDDV
jgi:hypothetical protein